METPETTPEKASRLKMFKTRTAKIVGVVLTVAVPLIVWKVAKTDSQESNQD